MVTITPVSVVVLGIVPNTAVFLEIVTTVVENVGVMA